jgi:outer membrane biosynthesis protein TonB
LNNVPVRRQATWALIASVILHLLLFLCVIFMTGLLPPPKLDFAKTKPALQELELTIVPPEPEPLQIVQPEELIQPRNERETIDSDGLAKAAEAPKDPAFESDENMKAASEKAGTGDEPLPTIEGKNLPFRNFKTQDVLLGSPKLPPAPALPEPVAPQPQPVAQKPEPQPAPEVAKATPPPLREVTKPAEDELAIAEKAKPATQPITKVIQPPPRPVPVPVQVPVADAPKPAEKVDMAKLITPPPRPQPIMQPGFQAQQEQTRIEGSISNRGKAAVDAVKTPLAVYRKQVNAAIGSRWYYYVKERRDLIAFGSVKVTYAITAKGKMVDVRVVMNTSNESLARICEQSIREAEIGPPPEEAQPAMLDGRLEGELSFTYYNTQ